nr:uncharacterized protein LOC109785655 [Aegilops tauschii subsp. strangulata]
MASGAGSATARGARRHRRPRRAARPRGGARRPPAEAATSGAAASWARDGAAKGRARGGQLEPRRRQPAVHGLGRGDDRRDGGGHATRRGVEPANETAAAASAGRGAACLVRRHLDAGLGMRIFVVFVRNSDGAWHIRKYPHTSGSWPRPWLGRAKSPSHRRTTRRRGRPQPARHRASTSARSRASTRALRSATPAPQRAPPSAAKSAPPRATLCADCRAPPEGGGGASLVEDYTGCPTLSEILRILSVKRRRRGRTSMPGSPTTSSKSYRRFRCVYQGRTDPLACIPHIPSLIPSVSFLTSVTSRVR